MTALWKRNLIGAVVVVVALVVYTGTELLPDWSTYRHTVTPAVIVPADQAGTVDGLTWRVTAVRHLAASPRAYADPLPKGTVLEVVSIDRSGAQPDGSCVGVITDGQRRWQAQGVGGFAVTPPDGATGNCTRPGPVQFTFVLPQDAVPTAVDVTDFSGRILVRLTL
ncbi:MAG: hypothetical protein ABWY93_08500 [Mycobacterium sp.]